MFSHGSFSTSTFDSSSQPRVYEPISNYLTYTQELLVEGAQVVTADSLSYIQSLNIPSLARVLRIHNGIVETTQTLYKPAIKRVHGVGRVEYIQTLIAPTIIRRHFEIPESVVSFTQAFYDVTLPKLVLVDNTLSFIKTKYDPVSRLLHKIDTLEYNQSLFVTKQSQLTNMGYLEYSSDVHKPAILQISFAELLEHHQTLINPRNLILVPLDPSEYQMFLNKPIINAYELLMDISSSTYWKAYGATREGKNIIVVQEIEHSANLLEISDE